MGADNSDRYIRVEAISARVLRWTVRGFVDQALQGAAQLEAERFLERVNGEVDAIVDLRGLEGFSPGAPMRGLRWAQAHADRIPRWVTLSTSRTVTALVRNAFPIVAPTLKFSMAEDEASALRLLLADRRSEPRVAMLRPDRRRDRLGAT